MSIAPVSPAFYSPTLGVRSQNPMFQGVRNTGDTTALFGNAPTSKKALKANILKCLAAFKPALTASPEGKITHISETMKYTYTLSYTQGQYLFKTLPCGDAEDKTTGMTYAIRGRKIKITKSNAPRGWFQAFRGGKIGAMPLSAMGWLITLRKQFKLAQAAKKADYECLLAHLELFKSLEENVRLKNNSQTQNQIRLLLEKAFKEFPPADDVQKKVILQELIQLMGLQDHPIAKQYLAGKATSQEMMLVIYETWTAGLADMWVTDISSAEINSAFQEALKSHGGRG